MAVKKRTLREFFDEIGHPQCAILFKVDISSIRNWRRGYCLPHVGAMERIVKLSKGAVTYEEMVTACLEFKKKSKKA